MTICIELLPDEPIIVATFQNPMTYRAEVPRMFQQIIDLRDTLDGYNQYYTVLDVSQVKVGFGDMVYTMGESITVQQQRRPDMPLRLVLIGKGALMELASRAMGQEQYGGYGTWLYTSLDEALEAIRVDLLSRVPG
jgi:hypothetical protein